MAGNEYQKLAMRDRMPAKKNSNKLDLLELYAGGVKDGNYQSNYINA